jgi:membrane dipeptidase
MFSELGRVLVREMNRIGMLVDLSHVSDDVMIQAIQISEAPVMFSHSSARSVCNVPRNVPDNVLKMIGTSGDKRDAVVMVRLMDIRDGRTACNVAFQIFQVNFASQFIAADGNATLAAVANHIDHIGNVAGRAQ